jgi:hypothetical protein
MQQSDLDFIKKYSVDSVLQQILDIHADEIASKIDEMKLKGIKKHGVWTFDWLPGYFVKSNVDRIYGLERMQKCIENHNLDMLAIAEKGIYHIKGKPLDLSSWNYVIIAKKVIPAAEQKPLSLRQVQQLITLMHETEYISLHESNYILTEGEKIVLIDTESAFNKNLIFEGFMRHLRGDLNKKFSDEALKYVLLETVRVIERGKHPKNFNKHRLLNFLEMHKSAARWDYSAYCKELLAR